MVYFEKNRAFKAGVEFAAKVCVVGFSDQGAHDLNVLAWDNRIGHWFCVFVACRPIFARKGGSLFREGSRADVMVNRDSWGYSYSMARGEILGFMEDERVRKHLSNMFSLIKNES